jgi:hypothetical protein
MALTIPSLQIRNRRYSATSSFGYTHSIQPSRCMKSLTVAVKSSYGYHSVLCNNE